MFRTLTDSELTGEILRIRELNPLVHCITNQVVQEITANVLLAVGASPAMIIAKEEAPDFARMASALLINIGTLDTHLAEMMILTSRAAGYAKTPWVLDPVAAGALLWRDSVLRKLLTAHPTVIRGNASEILSIAGCSSGGKGVDSTDSSDTALESAQNLALALNTIVAVTGQTDYVTNGVDTIEIHGGTALATKVVGTGCSLSALVATFLSKSENPLISTACACLLSKRAAEMALKVSHCPGSFKVAYIDSIYSLSESAK